MHLRLLRLTCLLFWRHECQKLRCGFFETFLAISSMTVNIPSRPALKSGFCRVQAGKQDGRLEGQDESVIIVALDSLNISVLSVHICSKQVCVFSVPQVVQKVFLKWVCWLLMSDCDHDSDGLDWDEVARVPDESEVCFAIVPRHEIAKPKRTYGLPHPSERTKEQHLLAAHMMRERKVMMTSRRVKQQSEGQASNAIAPPRDSVLLLDNRAKIK